MAYKVESSDSVLDSLSKLAKKDKVRYEYVKKKIEQLSENPYLGKPLRNILKGAWRVHIGSFVMVYEIFENKHIVRLLKFAHHDEAY